MELITSEKVLRDVMVILARADGIGTVLGLSSKVISIALTRLEARTEDDVIKSLYEFTGTVIDLDGVQRCIDGLGSARTRLNLVAQLYCSFEDFSSSDADSLVGKGDTFRDVAESVRTLSPTVAVDPLIQTALARLLRHLKTKNDIPAYMSLLSQSDTCGEKRRLHLTLLSEELRPDFQTSSVVGTLMSCFQSKQGLSTLVSLCQATHDETSTQPFFFSVELAGFVSFLTTVASPETATFEELSHSRDALPAQASTVEGLTKAMDGPTAVQLLAKADRVLLNMHQERRANSEFMEQPIPTSFIRGAADEALAYHPLVIACSPNPPPQTWPVITVVRRPPAALLSIRRTPHRN